MSNLVILKGKAVWYYRNATLMSYCIGPTHFTSLEHDIELDYPVFLYQVLRALQTNYIGIFFLEESGYTV